MKASAAFPSEYFRASDFDEGPQLKTMSRVEIRDLGDEHKPVLFFQDEEKKLVLNKTNANTISDGYGDEMNNWVGKKIVMFAATTDLRGKTVPCIRLRMPKKLKEELDDEVPF